MVQNVDGLMTLTRNIAKNAPYNVGTGNGQTSAVLKKHFFIVLMYQKIQNFILVKSNSISNIQKN